LSQTERQNVQPKTLIQQHSELFLSPISSMSGFLAMSEKHQNSEAEDASNRQDKHTVMAFFFFFFFFFFFPQN
jgi:hypothetical protein